MTTPKSTRTTTKDATPETAGATPAQEPAVIQESDASGETTADVLASSLIGLTPRQHVTAIIAGGVIGGLLARSKPYEALDLRKASEIIGMCDQIAEMVLHIDDPMPDVDESTVNAINS